MSDFYEDMISAIERFKLNMLEEESNKWCLVRSKLSKRSHLTRRQKELMDMLRNNQGGTNEMNEELVLLFDKFILSVKEAKLTWQQSRRQIDEILNESGC